MQKLLGLQGKSYLHVGAILVVTIAALWPVIANDWVNWDDQEYVLNNWLIRDLSLSGVAAIFSAVEVLGLYHPITLLSYAVDYSLAGVNAQHYHIVNLILHLLNACLVYVFVKSIGVQWWIPVLVAVLFGCHPMHVESVAWISGRKDLLFTLFYISGLIVYQRSATRQGSQRVLQLSLCFILALLSLLSKASAVTFPVVLLLLDLLNRRENNLVLWVEKLPFFALSIGFGLLAIKAQQAGMAMAGFGEIDWLKALILAGNGLAVFVLKALVPIGMSPFHPVPDMAAMGLPMQMKIFAIATLPFILPVLRYGSKEIQFGLAFFLVTIAPNLQIIPYGMAMYAERYSYLSYVGLFFAMCVVLGILEKRWRGSPATKVSVVVLIVWMIWLCSAANTQSRVWKNGGKLWSAVITKYPDEFYAYYNRGDYYLSQKDYDSALQDFNQSAQLESGYADTYNRRGVLYRDTGRDSSAMEDFGRALSLDSTNTRALVNRAVLLLAQGKADGAKMDVERAIQIDPDYALAHLNLGVVLESSGTYSQALKAYTMAARLEPLNPLPYRYRGVSNYMLNDTVGALRDISHAINLGPGNGQALFIRSLIYRDKGEFSRALVDAEAAYSAGYKVDSAYISELRSLFN